MMRSKKSSIARPTAIQSAFAWFLRIVAAYCLIFGIFYWVRLIGIYEGTLWRFDLMPVQWQIAVTCLAVLFPFAAMGLWMMVSWGPVIWFACAAGEVLMYGVLTDRFVAVYPIVVIHLLVAAAYIAFRIAMHLESRPR